VNEPLILSLEGWDWIVCGVVLFGSMLAGLGIALLKRREETSDSFFLAGRTLLWPVVGASLYATNIGAEHLVGLPTLLEIETYRFRGHSMSDPVSGHYRSKEEEIGRASCRERV
jgi:hypothetical protein